MKLISFYFEYGQDDRWQRMAKVLSHSCDRLNIINDVRKIKKPDIPVDYKVRANHYKLRFWSEAVQEATYPIILTDTDVFLQDDPSEAFDLIDHVGITFRDQQPSKLPLNGGVIFVKPTEKAKAFFRRWVEADDLLYNNRSQLAKWRAIYAGMNQASLGMLLETESTPVAKLHCSKYNLVEPWNDPEKAAIIHVKAHATHHIFSNCKTENRNVVTIKERWLELEKECQR